jgi:hypothetical protein
VVWEIPPGTVRPIPEDEKRRISVRTGPVETGSLLRSARMSPELEQLAPAQLAAGHVWQRLEPRQGRTLGRAPLVGHAGVEAAAGWADGDLVGIKGSGRPAGSAGRSETTKPPSASQPIAGNR